MAEKKQPAEDIRIEDDAKLLADTLDDILRYSGDSADEAYIPNKPQDAGLSGSVNFVV